MNSRDLEGEMRGYVRALRAQDWEELVAAGVKPLDILVHQMVGAATIRSTGDGRWEPATDRGARIFVTPVRAHPAAAAYDIESPHPREDALNGNLVDIVAWHPSRPDGWSMRTGDAIVLGSAPYRLPDETAASVRVHRGPLAWLRSGTEGIVLLTRDIDEQRRLMLGVGRIEVDDREHAIALRRALQPVYRPPAIVTADEPTQTVKRGNVVRLAR